MNRSPVHASVPGIGKATPADRSHIQAMLQAAGLPVEDLHSSQVGFWVARSERGIVGAIGVERHGEAGLLRSLVVVPDCQRSGTGSALVHALESAMRAEGIRTLVLLTQTAEAFFAGRGYVVTQRDAVPDAVRRSSEFRTLCPASAVCMVKALRRYNVLFLCTGNSARSILAESILNHRFSEQFQGFSAGSYPAGKVNPGAIELLAQLGIATEGLRSKSWDEFAMAGAPPLDFIVTVCDNAAGEVCPVWPGKPMTAHWGVADPAHVEDPVARALAFREAFRVLSRRVELFANLPIASLDNMALGARLRAIGTITE